MRAAVAGLLAAVVLAGCGGLRREARPTVWLALEPPPARGGLRAGGPSLEVASFASAAPFGTDRVASRASPYRWEFAAHHRWVAEPGAMVSAGLREALGSADLFGAVLTAPPREADYVLSGAVRRLYWDRAAGVAVLEVEASLVTGAGRGCGFWVRRAETAAAGDSVDAFLAAASEGLAKIAGGLTADLAAGVASCGPPPDP